MKGNDDMSYTFKQNLVSSSKHSIKCPYTRTPKYVVIHNTYNNASAKNVSILPQFKQQPSFFPYCSRCIEAILMC